jgi:hypothetical protein
VLDKNTKKPWGVVFVYPWFLLVSGTEFYADPWADLPKKNPKKNRDRPKNAIKSARQQHPFIAVTP